MTHHEAFLQDIIANPDDDAPRLIYADWLEEHGGDLAERFRAILAAPADDAPRIGYACLLERQGDWERAEFVRVQCELSGLETLQRADPKLFCWWGYGEGRDGSCSCTGSTSCGRRNDLRCRERELLDGILGLGVEMLPVIDGMTRSNFVGRGRYGWFPGTPDPAHGIEAEFRRGWPEILTCTAADWLAHADALTAAAPIRRVRLTTLPDAGSPDPGIIRLVAGEYRRQCRVGDSVDDLPLGQRACVTAALRAEWPGIEFELPSSDPRQTVQLQKIWH